MARKLYLLNISSINSSPNAWLTNFDPNNVQAGGAWLNIGNNPNQPIVTEPINPTSPTQFSVTLTQLDISLLPPNTQWQAITYPFTITAVSPGGNNVSGTVVTPGIRGGEDEWSARSQAGEDEKKSKTKKKVSKATAS